MQFPELVLKIKEYVPEGEHLYLVGGAIRDALLGFPSKDFDFVCSSNPRAIARKFADRHHAAFYMLDEERNTCRVIIDPKLPQRMIFDFSQIRGDSIIDDLMERDFTINAMAVDIETPDQIIDPSHGGRDLQQKRLKLVRNSSIADDPVRAIRSIRYAVNLDLSIDPETVNLIRLGSKGLVRVSKERKRDEIFKILEGNRIGAAAQLMEKFSIFENSNIQPVSDFKSGCRCSEVLDQMIALLCGRSTADKNASFYKVSLLLRLGRFKESLEEHFYQKKMTGRNRKSLLMLAMVMKINHDEQVNELSNQLALSSDEWSILHTLAGQMSYQHEYWQDRQNFDRRSIYRYFHQNGDVGVDLAFIALATYASRVGGEFIQLEWLRLLENCEVLLQAWYSQPEIINPKPFLNGNDLMFHFDLNPGPMLGEIIEEMKEEQAAGNIQSKEDAIDWIDFRLLRNSLKK